MGLILLINILPDNRIDLTDNHRKLTNTYKNQSCLRQALKNRLGLKGLAMTNLMGQLLTNGSILDDNPLIFDYTQSNFISDDKQTEILDIIEDHHNPSYVSNYEYACYKKKTDNQDTIIELLQSQLDQLSNKLEILEKRDDESQSRIVKQHEFHDESISNLRNDITSLRSQNKVLMDKVRRNLKPIPEEPSNQGSLSSQGSQTTLSNNSIITRVTLLTSRLDKIEQYLFRE